jgi:hypothetical protein
MEVIKESEGKLLCPTCSTDQIHLGFVQGEQQKFSTRITGNRVVTLPIRLHDKDGSLIELKLWCENNHEFSYIIEWDRGSVYVELQTNGTLNPNVPPPKMWTRPHS